MTRLTLLCLAALFSALAQSAPMVPTERFGLDEPLPGRGVALPALDKAALLAADREGAKLGKPAHYSKPLAIEPVRVAGGTASRGEWIHAGGDQWLWRMQISASNATSIDLGFRDYWLPHGAELYVYDIDRTLVRGPFTDRHNKAHGELWTPVIPGDQAMIELVVPERLRNAVSLELFQVNYGFRFFNSEAAKSGSCNVDVVCPEGDGFRDQIRAEATYGLAGTGAFCSGQMVNSTANDNKPLFLTANHCGVSASQAASLTVYWNYESPTCRVPGSSGSGVPLNINNFTDTQTGATLLAETTTGGGVINTDFAILELDEIPPASYNVHWMGWDRTGTAPDGGIAIHHPSTDEKRISFTNLPLIATDYLEETGGSTHWRVRSWDLGTTEPGSSGSMLLDPDGRMIGWLSGGFASCSSDPDFCTGGSGACDWYGRLSESWDIGTAANRRLRDWLDPLGTGQQVIDGTDACDKPVVTVSSNANPAATGQSVSLSASVTGGQAPYSFAWDVDGDNGIDSTADSVSAAFPNADRASISLRVVDAAQCATTVQFGQVIEAPDIAVDSVGTPMEVCGDGDAEVEPGETWSYPVSLRNNGTAAAFNAAAGFAVSQAGAGQQASKSGDKRTGGPDGFGYTFQDSRDPTCAFDFRDINNTGTVLSLSGQDDAGTVVDLGGTGFNFYGVDLSRVTMSTNGYLSTAQSDGGNDFSNDCPIPSTPDNGGGGRIMPLHDDLFRPTGLHQYFGDCPRVGDVGGSAGCNIFQWSDSAYFDDRNVSLTIQAILYDGSNEIVYQYLPGFESPAASASVGIQNGSASIGLSYACDDNSLIEANSAVCIFHPDSPGAETLSEGIVLESPALDAGNIGVGQTATVDLVIQIDSAFSCGSLFSIDYLGAGHDTGFSESAAGDVLSVQVGPGGCDSSASCPAATMADPRDGFWFNATRPGNGIDLHFIGDQMYSAWYTAEPGRVPVWYYVQTLSGQRLEGGQLRANILRFTLTGDIAATTPTFEVVGEAVFSFIDSSNALMTWTINGVTSGERVTFFDIDVGSVNAEITDQWFNPGEAGWGLGVHQQGAQEFTAVYFYGTDGEPRWVVTIDNTADDGAADVAAFNVHCPGCAWIPPTLLPAGTFSRSYESNGTGMLNMDVNLEGDTAIEWLRDALPIQRINPN